MIWHIFIVVWSTGCIVFAVRWHHNSEHQQLKRSLDMQILQTRRAELQARERKALNVGN